jgi:hypothetical protein
MNKQEQRLFKILDDIRATSVIQYPSLELLSTETSITLPTTPTVFKATTIAVANSFSFDTNTGIVTVSASGTYSVDLKINAQPTVVNNFVYFYAEINTGSGWVIDRYSARKLLMPSFAEIELLHSVSKFLPAGAQFRHYIWGDATTNLKTTNLPGTTAGTVTVPAYKLQMS